MSHTPFISICIPAYKNPDYLQRLLESICIQTYKDFEIIITDDSPDESISAMVGSFGSKLPITYQKNNSPKGSPENWNESIRLAKGKWIKIMHDDDWFADQESLAKFFEATSKTNGNFIFSGYQNIYLERGNRKNFKVTHIEKWLLKRNPLLLFYRNYIGHPSTTLILNEKHHWFDPRIKWVVDIEFYIRILKKANRFYYIDEPLINIGMSNQQITHDVFRKKEVEIPENIYLLNKIGHESLKNIFVFDNYWRLMRNLNIKSLEDVKMYSKESKIPYIIQKMILLQNSFMVKSLMRYRFFSKSISTVAYICFLMSGKFNA